MRLLCTSCACSSRAFSRAVTLPSAWAFVSSFSTCCWPRSSLRVSRGVSAPDLTPWSIRCSWRSCRRSTRVSWAKAGVATASATIPMTATLTTCIGRFLLVTGWGRDRPYQLLSVRRIYVRGRLHGRSGGAGLEIRALARDLVAREGEEIAAVDLDRLPLRGRAGEAPLREPAGARDEVPRLREPRVREHLEHPCERPAHVLAPGVARATRLGARGGFVDTVLRHEGHQQVDVVTVPASLEERVQIVCGHHEREHRAGAAAASIPHTSGRERDRVPCMSSAMPSGPIHLCAHPQRSHILRPGRRLP